MAPTKTIPEGNVTVSRACFSKKSIRAFLVRKESYEQNQKGLRGQAEGPPNSVPLTLNRRPETVRIDPVVNVVKAPRREPSGPVKVRKTRAGSEKSVGTLSYRVELYRRTGDRAKADEYLTTATSMYREMDMGFWLAEAELKALS